eukprot:Skav228450  [mRNA]  locus=scaffold1058:104593:105496:- [translate_table: standard]
MEAGEATVELHVTGLDGSSLDFRLRETTSGVELGRMIKAHLPKKPGARIQVHFGAEILQASSHSWLPEALQLPDDVTLTYVFVPATVHAAWCYIKGFPVDEEELAVQGVTSLTGIDFDDQLIDLPETLETWDELLHDTDLAPTVSTTTLFSFGSNIQAADPSFQYMYCPFGYYMIFVEWFALGMFVFWGEACL